MYRHDSEVQNGLEQKYATRVLTSEKNLLPLCIIEGLYIEKQDNTLSMNERNENGRGGIVRLTACRIT